MRSLIAGAGLAIAGRAVFTRLVREKFRRDLERLNAGDYRPLLAGYADDAVLRFNEGPHRWSGEHRGRAAIEAFLRDFTAAGLQGELGDVWMGGPPWALRLAARFDDRATGPDGEELYANRLVIVLRLRWHKIVEHEDFYEDTGRIATLELGLQALGVKPAG